MDDNGKNQINQYDNDIENQDNTAITETSEISELSGNSDISEKSEIETTQEMLDAELLASEYVVDEEYKKRAVEEAFDWIEIFSSSFLMVILLFTFVFRLVTVDGPSMEDTLHGGSNGKVKDNLVISKLFYTPKQGDIVVIQVPNPQYKMPIIKRVIATEGQTVDIDFETWIVYVDGQPLYEVDGEPAIEPYVNYEPGKFMNMESITHDMLPITVEPGKIFVLGDNRNHSSDSRSSSIGQIDVRNVVGRVLLRVFPFYKFGVV